MSERSRAHKLKDAVKRLSKYYSSSDTLIPNSKDDKTFKEPPTNPVEKLIRDFTEVGESIQSVGHFCIKAKETKGDIPVVIIPANKTVAASGEKIIDNKLSAAKKKLRGRGCAQNGEFKWNVEDDLTLIEDNGSKETLLPMHVVAICHPKVNPSSVNTEISSVVLNSIPTLEMSKAIPYLNVEFLGTVPSSTLFKEGKFRGITTSNYLLGQRDAKSSEVAPYKDFITADFLTDGASDGDDAMLTYAGMDVFTSPQTMLPAEIFDENRRMVDPFRPLMSIKDFSVDALSPAFGLDTAACDVSAKLTLVLHDRKRLVDVADLVKPGGFQEGNLLRVTYGYSHPDANVITQQSQAQKSSSVYGDILNGLRVSEIYSVINSDFSLSDSGEVQIDISAFSMGSEASWSALDITDAYSSKTETLATLTKELKVIQLLVSGLDKKKFSKVSTPSILTLGGKLGGKKISSKQLKKIKAFVTAIKAKSDDRSLQSQVGEIAEAINGLFFDKSQKLNKAHASRSEYLTKILNQLERTPDPFLSPRPPGILVNHGLKKSYLESKNVREAKTGSRLLLGPSFISLGKLFSVILGTPLRRAYTGNVSEIQMNFYGFNESAGAVQDYNICSMPLKYTDVKKLIKKEFEDKASISLRTFINLVNDNFIRTKNNKAYGISGLKNSVLKDEALEKLYYSDENLKGFPAPFKIPELGLTARMLPGTLSPGIDSTTNILRVEIFDRRATSNSVYERLIEAASESGVFFPLTRATADSPIAMNHQKYAAESEKNIQHFLGPLSNADFPKVSGMEKVINTIKTKAKKIKIDADAISLLMRSAYPTIVYGSATTGILSAKVNSRKDDNAIELALARQKNALSSQNPNEGIEEFVAEVYPVECGLETIGNPYFSFGQTFMVDFGTKTNMDNIYTVTKVSHRLSEGNYTTSLDLVQLEGYPVLVSPLSTTRKIIEGYATAAAAEKTKKEKQERYRRYLRRKRRLAKKAAQKAASERQMQAAQMSMADPGQSVIKPDG